MFSRTCAAFEAPVMTVDTLGFLAHHASENCASVTSSSSAITLRSATFLLRRFVGEHALQPFVAGQRRARAVRHAVQVLAGQQTRRQWRPDRVPRPMSS